MFLCSLRDSGDLNLLPDMFSDSSIHSFLKQEIYVLYSPSVRLLSVNMGIISVAYLSHCCDLLYFQGIGVYNL